MSALRQRIESRLRERVEAGAETSPDPGRKPDFGPLFTRLDDVIQVVEGIRDFSVEPYYDRVREIVCSTCRQDEHGGCAARDSQVCGLDRYFPLIVAIIEQELKNDPGLRR
ncbi:MAG: hypothetical protein HY718_09170 [Planctomycetes bacterium]|nr:hypothetical protein [Planctomycetota bacterium]